LTSNVDATLNKVSVYAFLRPLKFSIAKYPALADGSQKGDLAESWEVSPDKLQIVLKVRDGLKWDRRQPTNGRAIDSEDVTWSWAKYLKLNPGASDVKGVIQSVTATDNRTVVIKLGQPDTIVQTWLSSSGSGFYIMPREGESAFDPKTTLRGNGPYLLDDKISDIGPTWKRNPDYWVKDRPFFDQIDAPIVSEYAQQLAQFRAGNIHTDIFVRTQQDVIQTKKDLPKANLYQAAAYSSRASNYTWFGYEGDSPFKDVRARQALSMLIDRNLWHDVSNFADKFRNAGLDATGKKPSVIGVGYTGYWRDPDDAKAFGDNAKYLQYNPDEAKKLLEAAAVGNKEVKFYGYGPIQAFIDNMQVLAGMWATAGLKVTPVPLDATTFLRDYYYGYLQGNGYDGLLDNSERPYESPDWLLAGTFSSKGGSYHGLTPTGSNAKQGDPKLDDMIVKIRAEFDRPKQQSLVHEAISYITGQMYAIPRPVTMRSYSMAWPAVSNYNTYSRWADNVGVWTEDRQEWWLDTSQPPFA
jgi:ABC-type transport system substrate-binding protein